MWTWACTVWIFWRRPQEGASASGRATSAYSTGYSSASESKLSRAAIEARSLQCRSSRTMTSGLRWASAVISDRSARNISLCSSSLDERPSTES